MHTAHCARNITLCKKCKEPIPKSQFEEHSKSCKPQNPKKIPSPQPPPTKIEESQYFRERKAVEDKKILHRQEKRLERLEKLVDVGQPLGRINNASPFKAKPPKDLLPCQYCELELPKFDLGEHENYCGARTEKCQDCGELVMFKYRQLHKDSNNCFLKLNDGESKRG